MRQIFGEALCPTFFNDLPQMTVFRERWWTPPDGIYVPR